MSGQTDDPPLRPSEAAPPGRPSPSRQVIELDTRRTSGDFFATLLRRSMRGQASFAARPGHEQADALLLLGPARNWPEAAPRLRHLIEHYMMTLPGQASREQTLARRALRDIAVLLADSPD